MREPAILSCLVLLLSLHSSVEADVSVNTVPSPLRAVYGDTFTVSCNYQPHTFHMWRHPTLGEITESTGALSGGEVTLQVTTFAHYSALIIRNNNLARDNGTYTCVVRTSSGQLISRSTEASLFPPVAITSPNNQVVSTVEGEASTARLNCTAVNHTRIVWRRADGGTITNTTDERIVVYDNAMVIRGVRFGDNGTYVCTAVNLADSAYIVIEVVVRVGASVTATPSTSAVADHSSAQFVFTVRGYPLPSVDFYKGTIGDDFRIATPGESPRVELVTTGTISKVYHMTFDSVTSADTGTYICQVQNQYGGPTSDSVTLQLNDALGPPQQVRASAYSTRINITWNRPDGNDEVDQYTVTWQTRSGAAISYVVNGNTMQYIIEEGLTRLTQYTVYVFASNTRGRGSNSQMINVTTGPVLPSAPSEISITDIGPTSVKLGWSFSDDGGAAIDGIRVTLMTFVEETEHDYDVEPGQRSAVIPELMDSKMYRLRLQLRNRIGVGPPMESGVFETAPPGRPGSPSHVTAMWMSGDQSALVCWEPSEVGQPFISYTIDVLEVKSNVTKVWKLAADLVKSDLPNCTSGYQVTGLMLEVCYRFKVGVSNSQGMGFPSDYSEEFCVPSSNNGGLQSGSEKPLLDTKYVVIVAVCLSVIILVAVGIIAWCICVRVRHHRRTAKFPTLPPEDRRRSSARSDRMLLDDNGAFHHQISVGSSVSGNSVSGEETPNTAATMVSESPFTFENTVNTHSVNGSGFAQENGGGHFNRSASGLATLPINGLALYPIPEDAPTSHTLPSYGTPSRYPYPGDHLPSYPYYPPAPPSSVSVPDKYTDEHLEMTDNPLNDAFEKKMSAVGHGPRPNFSHEIDLPEDEPPPYVPPYRGDDMESDMSIPIGESCSLPPRSPQLSFQQRNNNKNRTNHDRSLSQQSGINHNVLTATSFKISCSDEEDEDTEFIDNEAYQKVQDSEFVTRLPVENGYYGSQNTIGSSSRCSPVASIEGAGYGSQGYGSQQQIVENDADSKPKFKIRRGGRRGEVFEKVELRH